MLCTARKDRSRTRIHPVQCRLGAAGGPNALAVQTDAIFWLETTKAIDGTIKHQLQYSQKVLLNFNGLSWPHVSVATLTKTP